MARELAEVNQAVGQITRSQLATVYKWADGVSTPTPPGHWNFIAAPYIAAAKFSEVRAARALALVDMALHDAAVACWDAKFTYYNPRPSHLDPEIKTMVGLPNFPSYTSGHSTFSAAAAAVLSYLFPNGAAVFDREKDEAALSRLYGASTSGRTSRSARNTAAASVNTRCGLPGPTVPTARSLLRPGPRLRHSRLASPSQRRFTEDDRTEWDQAGAIG